MKKDNENHNCYSLINEMLDEISRLFLTEEEVSQISLTYQMRYRYSRVIVPVAFKSGGSQTKLVFRISKCLVFSGLTHLLIRCAGPLWRAGSRVKLLRATRKGMHINWIDSIGYVKSATNTVSVLFSLCA